MNSDKRIWVLKGSFLESKNSSVFNALLYFNGFVMMQNTELFFNLNERIKMAQIILAMGGCGLEEWHGESTKCTILYVEYDFEPSEFDKELGFKTDEVIEIKHITNIQGIEISEWFEGADWFNECLDKAISKKENSIVARDYEFEYREAA